MEDRKTNLLGLVYNILIVLVAKVTHFGDPSDKEDSGIGAWGFDYRARLDFPGISLPIPTVRKLGLKQFHPVKVYHPADHKLLYCFLIDKGPSINLHRDAD